MPPLETTLKSVTVYPDRARLACEGRAALQAGIHTLEVAGLPAQLDADSLRAQARGTARARLLGVQLQRTFYSETPAEQARQLEEQLESLQDNAEQVAARSALVKQNRAALDALANNSKAFARALAKGDLTPEAHLAAMDGLRARAEALDAELQQLAIEKRRLERLAQKVASELKQIGASRQRERLTGLVEVEVLEPGELTVGLTYVIGGAGWKPLYDIRLVEEGAEAAIEIGYLAQVTQHTGLPWDAVALSLSTARPALAGKAPELNPWYVQPRVVPPPQPLARARGEVGPAMLSVAAPAPAPAAFEAQQLLPIEEAAAQVDSSGAAVTYHVPGATSIPSDGQPHKVTVAHFTLKPDLDYVSAPRLVEAVYRRATVVNDSPYLLLPGAANLFVGEEFIGASSLELTAPQGEFELYLGVDDRLKVERELKRREVGKLLIGGKRRMVYGYEISLENLLDSAAKLTLHDQIPVSRHEDIKVKLESVEPKPAEQTELNLLNWELSLAPKEKRTVRLDFSVEAPQTLTLLGLP